MANPRPVPVDGLRLSLALVMGLILLLAGAAHLRAKSLESGPTVFERLLEVIPNNAATRAEITMVDLDQLFSSQGVKRPSPGAEGKEAEAFHDFIAGGGGFSGARGVLIPVGGWGRGTITRSTVGYDATSVRGHVLAGPSYDPTSTDVRAYEAIVGDFSPEASRAATESCGGCGLERARFTYAGVEYYGWGPDFRRNLRIRFQPPAFDEWGTGGRLAFLDSYVLRTNWSAGMEEMIDAYQGTASLARNPDYTEMARRMAEEGAIWVHMNNQTFSVATISEVVKSHATPGSRASQGWAPAPGEAILKPFYLQGWGLGEVKGEYFSVVILLHGSAREARENVGLLARRFTQARWRSNQNIQLESLRIYADDRVLIARVRGVVGASVFAAPDGLLIHE